MKNFGSNNPRGIKIVICKIYNDYTYVQVIRTI